MTLLRESLERKRKLTEPRVQTGEEKNFQRERQKIRKELGQKSANVTTQALELLDRHGEKTPMSYLKGKGHGGLIDRTLVSINSIESKQLAKRREISIPDSMGTTKLTTGLIPEDGAETGPPS